MSIEAMVWAMNLAPVPHDKSKPNAACAAVLIGLANHADPDGRAAFPAVDTIVRYTRLSRRTVVTAIDRLADDGIIVACDPDVIAAKIKRADRRPKGYDLRMDLMRSDLTTEELTAVARSNPMLRHQIEAHLSGVQQLHVVDGAQGAEVVERVAMDPARGATTATRGAAVAPEPTMNPPREPSMNDDSLRSSSRTATRLPEGWEPDERLRSWFTNRPELHVVNPRAETEKMIDWARAAPDRSGRKKDWNAFWRNWMRSAADRAQGRPSAARSPQRPAADPAWAERVDGLWGK